MTIRNGDPSAIEELRQHHARLIDPSAYRIADPRLVPARSYAAGA
jgi:hypothetical protein